MGEEKKWYRVSDPLSPLCGCDVRVHRGFVTIDPDTMAPRGYDIIIALRRIDVFVGDRPFQLIAKEGEDLGLLIDRTQLDLSPLQDETVETGTDRPHGLCLDESEMTRKDGVTLRIARYERATQIAVEDAEGDMLGTSTDSTHLRAHWEKAIIDMFEGGDEVEDIAYALRSN